MSIVMAFACVALLVLMTVPVDGFRSHPHQLNRVQTERGRKVDAATKPSMRADDALCTIQGPEHGPFFEVDFAMHLLHSKDHQQTCLNKCQTLRQELFKKMPTLLR